MNIIWSGVSRNQLQEIYDYHSLKVHSKLALTIIERIIKDAQRLIDNPFIGQHEALLSDRPQGFRYLVSGNYKIIYWIDDEKIRIASFFDTRQNPEKMKSI